LLIRSHAEVSTLAVFIGVIGGVAAFGAIGVIAGPVLLTLVLSLLGYLDASLQSGGAVPPVDPEPPAGVR
jgi:predicted PurR-regulated permease PerM